MLLTAVVTVPPSPKLVSGVPSGLWRVSAKRLSTAE